MAPRNILHMITPLKHMSPFDANMAVDAGFDVCMAYASATTNEVKGLVQDAIFSRSPEGLKHTGVFIGGKRVIEAIDMMEAARAAMVPPFEISVFADPAGSFTTAAAMVACVRQALMDLYDTDFEGKRVIVYGGTGVVGFSSAVIAALEGAHPCLVGYDGPERVGKLASEAKARFDAEMDSADGSTEQQKGDLVKDADIVFSAGPAGMRLLTAEQLKHARKLMVATDVNAVPPSGVEGIEVNDDCKPIPNTDAVGIGALTIGNVKYGTESGLFKQMIKADRPMYLDFREAYKLAKHLTPKKDKKEK